MYPGTPEWPPGPLQHFVRPHVSCISLFPPPGGRSLSVLLPPVVVERHLGAGLALDSMRPGRSGIRECDPQGAALEPVDAEAGRPLARAGGVGQVDRWWLLVRVELDCAATDALPVFAYDIEGLTLDDCHESAEAAAELIPFAFHV